jgi:hypothetical protein
MDSITFIGRLAATLVFAVIARTSESPPTQSPHIGEPSPVLIIRTSVILMAGKGRLARAMASTAPGSPVFSDVQKARRNMPPWS